MFQEQLTVQFTKLNRRRHELCSLLSTCPLEALGHSWRREAVSPKTTAASQASYLKYVACHLAGQAKTFLRVSVWPTLR